jgi:hypothetical protein
MTSQEQQKAFQEEIIRLFTFCRAENISDVLTKTMSGYVIAEGENEDCKNLSSMIFLSGTLIDFFYKIEKIKNTSNIINDN